MNTAELKTAVAAKLADSGIGANKQAGIKGLCNTVIEHTGVALGPGEKPYAYLMRYLGTKQRESTGYRPPFRRIEPEDVKPHNRLAGINRGQPPFMTPRGMAGNGDEHSKVWRR